MIVLVGPLAGRHSPGGISIGLYAEEGYEGRIRNCADLYLTIAKRAVKLNRKGWVALDPPWDGPHVFAKLEKLS